MTERDIRFTPEEIAAVLLALSASPLNQSRVKRPEIKKHLTSFKAKACNFKVIAGNVPVSAVFPVTEWQDPREFLAPVDPLILLERK